MMSTLLLAKNFPSLAIHLYISIYVNNERKCLNVQGTTHKSMAIWSDFVLPGLRISSFDMRVSILHFRCISFATRSVFQRLLINVTRPQLTLHCYCVYIFAYLRQCRCSRHSSSFSWIHTHVHFLLPIGKVRDPFSSYLRSRATYMTYIRMLRCTRRILPSYLHALYQIEDYVDLPACKHTTREFRRVCLSSIVELLAYSSRIPLARVSTLFSPL